MSESLEFIIKPSVFDRARKLVIDKDFIEFDSEYFSDPPIKIPKPEIEGFRYGIKWIRGYQFVIGKIYRIDIRTTNNQVIKIRLKTLYGIRKKQLDEKYLQIINALYDYFFFDIARQYINNFNNGEQIEMLGIVMSDRGVAMDAKAGQDVTLDANLSVIPWKDIGIKAYSRYFSVFSKSNPKKYKVFEYLYHWNAGILFSVSRQILKDKGLLNGEEKL